MATSTVKTEIKSGVLNVLLSRPKAHNALNPDIIKELTEIFRKIKKDDSILAATIRGEGPSFCSGGDLQWMRKSLKFSTNENLKDTQKLSDMYEVMFTCPVPLLALVHGNVMGGGVGLTAVCDIVAGHTETKFCFTEVKLGLVPSIIAPYILRKIPESQARSLIFTAEIFRGPQAEKLGLIQYSGNADECDAFLNEKLNLILANGPQAVRVAKDLVQKIKTTSWQSTRKLTVKTIAERRISKEGQEGMNAFFDKRKPSWRKGD